MYTSVSALTFGGPPLGDWEEGKESQNPELLLFVCVFWSFDFSGFSVYLSCEEGCADWWLLTLARLARVLVEALHSAIQRRVTRTRTKARTDRTRAAVPNVSPVAMRRRHAKQIGFFFFCPQCYTYVSQSRFCPNFLKNWFKQRGRANAQAEKALNPSQIHPNIPRTGMSVHSVGMVTTSFYKPDSCLRVYRPDDWRLRSAAAEAGVWVSAEVPRKPARQDFNVRQQGEAGKKRTL